MYVITEGLAKVNGKTVETFEREISEGRVSLQIEAGTTGYTGEPTREAGGRTSPPWTAFPVSSDIASHKIGQ